MSNGGDLAAGFTNYGKLNSCVVEEDNFYNNLEACDELAARKSYSPLIQNFTKITTPKYTTESVKNDYKMAFL